MGTSFGFLTTRPDPPHTDDTYSEVLAAHLAAAGAQSVVAIVGATPGMPSGSAGVRSGSDANAMLTGAHVVVVDHEIRGDDELDRVIAEVVEALTVPVIAVGRRPPRAPRRAQRQVLGRIGAVAQTIVAPSAFAAARLAVAYRVARGRVVVIPDETPPPPRSSGGRDITAPTMATYGLVGPGRGLENVIDATAALRSLVPRPRYHIVGPTDPAALARDGETYRHVLMARTIDRGVADMVSVLRAEHTVTGASGSPADLLVVARTCPRQVASPEVVNALAGGTPVVAVATAETAGVAVAAGIDRIVRAGDTAALVRVLRHLLTDVDLLANAARRDRHGRRSAWTRIAAQYQDLADALLAEHRQPAA